MLALASGCPHLAQSSTLSSSHCACQASRHQHEGLHAPSRANRQPLVANGRASWNIQGPYWLSSMMGRRRRRHHHPIGWGSTGACVLAHGRGCGMRGPEKPGAEVEAEWVPCCASQPSWCPSSGGGRTSPRRRSGNRGGSCRKVRVHGARHRKPLAGL